MVQRTRKHTYAERVLNAIADIRSEKKKSSVHISAIKAQIQRNVEEENDLIGPHWQTWVKSAIRKLESNGILERSARGSLISLTAGAKSSISNARRTSRNPKKSSSIHDDSIWHRVLEEFSDSVSPGSTRGSEGKRPLSRMRKAELYEEARKMQEELEKLRARDHERSNNATELSVPGSGAISPPEDDEEMQIVEVTLEQPIPEVAVVEADTTLVNEDELMDEVEDRPVLTCKPSRLHPLLQLQRTASGSYISAISKQPTPEPSDYSDPGSPSRMDDFDMSMQDDSVLRNDGIDLGPASPGIPEKTFAGNLSRYQMHTPESTPPRSFAGNVLLLGKRAAQVIAERDEAVRELQAKADMATAELNSKALEMQSFREVFEIRVLSYEESLRNLKFELAKRQGQDDASQRLLKDTLGQLQQKEQDITNIRLAAQEWEDRVKELSGKDELQPLLLAHREIQALCNELQISTHQFVSATADPSGEFLSSTVIDALTTCKTRASELHRELQNAQTRAALSEAQSAATAAALERTRESAHALEIKLAAVESKSAGRSDENDALRREAKSLRAELDLMRHSEASLHASLASAMEQLGELSARFEEKDVDLSESRRQTEEIRRREEASAMELHLAVARACEKDVELAQKDSALEKSNAALAIALERLATVELVVGKAESRSQELETQMNVMLQSLTSNDSTIASLKAGYARMKNLHLQSLEELDRGLSMADM